MKQFFASELAAMSEEVQAMLCRKVEELTRDSLWNGEEWVADFGGDVLKGHMVGTVTGNGELDFHYQHLNKDRQVRIGTCHSIPKVMDHGKIALQEKWQWLNGDLSCGESVVIEK